MHGDQSGPASKPATPLTRRRTRLTESTCGPHYPSQLTENERRMQKRSTWRGRRAGGSPVWGQCQGVSGFAGFHCFITPHPPVSTSSAPSDATKPTPRRLGRVKRHPICRVASAGCPAEALTRSGQGDFHHPALPGIRLAFLTPRWLRPPEGSAEGRLVTGLETSPNSDAPGGPVAGAR